MSTKMKATAAAVIIAAVTAMPAMAKDTAHGTVTAKGEFMDQNITAPIRKTSVGKEVLLPGGTWLDCAGDCEQALRNATSGFWVELEESEK